MIIGQNNWMGLFWPYCSDECLDRHIHLFQSTNVTDWDVKIWAGRAYPNTPEYRDSFKRFFKGGGIIPGGPIINGSK